MMMNEKPAILQTTFILILGVYCLVTCWLLFQRHNQYQWDFKVYYYASKAYASGLNPYQSESLSELSKSSITLRYVYPPLTLYLFRPFVFFNYDTSYMVFLLLKLFVLVALVLIWKREFIKEDNEFAFYVFVLFAFDSAVTTDLAAGNIAVFESFLIWLALISFLKHRYVLFCILIVSASLFKLTPILFLPLILMVEQRQRRHVILPLLALCCFAFYIGANYWFEPTLFREFLGNIMAIKETGKLNPSTLSLITDVFSQSQKYEALSRPSILQILLFILAVTAITTMSIRKLANFNKLDMETAQRYNIQVFIYVLVYALILPRYKNYSFILQILPAYYLIQSIAGVAKQKQYILGIVLMIVFSVRLTLPGSNLISYLFSNYYQILAVFALWGGYMFAFSRFWKINSRFALSGARPL